MNLDRRVANHAFAAWGWRGAVRIDYYGSGGEEMSAHVRSMTPTPTTAPG